MARPSLRNFNLLIFYDTIYKYLMPWMHWMTSTDKDLQTLNPRVGLMCTWYTIFAGDYVVINTSIYFLLVSRKCNNLSINQRVSHSHPLILRTFFKLIRRRSQNEFPLIYTTYGAWIQVFAIKTMLCDFTPFHPTARQWKIAKTIKRAW